MKRQTALRIAALAVSILVISLVFPQAYFLGLSFGVQAAEAETGCMPDVNQVAVFTGENYGGDCKYLPIGSYPTHESIGLSESGHNYDVVSSIKVGANVYAELYENINFNQGSGGSMVKIESDTPKLSAVTFDNKASSIKVIQKTTQPSTTPAGTPATAAQITDVTLNPTSPVVGQEFIISIKTSGIASRSDVSGITMELYDTNGLQPRDISPVVIDTTALNCPAECLHKMAINRAGTFTYRMIVNLRSGGTPLEKRGSFTITAAQTPAQTQTGNTNICSGCQSAGRVWCVSRDYRGYPQAYCANTGKECNQGESSYTGGNCPSSALLCQEACTSSYSQYFMQVSYATTQATALGIPIAACYPRSMTQVTISTLTAGTSDISQVYLQPPLPISGNGLCADPENACWCSILRMGQTTTGSGTSTIPGTDKSSHWPPDEYYYVSDPPRADANAVDCSKKSDASIKAEITSNGETTGSAKVFAAGQPVTIEGEVGYFSNVCNGYTYNCERFQELTCKYEKKTFSESLTYRNCPASLPTRITATGEQDKTCVGCIVSMVIPALVAIVIIAASLGTGGAAIASAIGTMLEAAAPALDGKNVNTQSMICAAAKGAMNIASAYAAQSNANANTNTNTKTTGKIIGEIAVGHVTGQFIGAAQAQSTGECIARGGTCYYIDHDGYAANVGGYFTRWYCSDTPLDNQCKFSNPAIANCQTCITAGNKWCYSSTSGYCASTTGPSPPQQYSSLDQNCYTGYTQITDSTKCSTISAAAGGTQAQQQTQTQQQTTSGKWCEDYYGSRCIRDSGTCDQNGLLATTSAGCQSASDKTSCLACVGTTTTQPQAQATSQLTTCTLCTTAKKVWCTTSTPSENTGYCRDTGDPVCSGQNSYSIFTVTVGNNPAANCQGLPSEIKKNQAAADSSTLSNAVISGLDTMSCGMPALSGTILKDEPCYTVCGKEYTTAAAAAPRCNEGGAVKSYQEAQYSCSPRSCGGLANQKVAIIIMRGNDVLSTDTTTTDEGGNFSYTFTAPQIDDTIQIVLKTSIK